MNSTDCVTLENKDGIAWITLNRPDALNALNIEVLSSLSEILDDIANRDAYKAVIITGAGNKAFSAGADIKYMSTATPLQVREFANLAIGVNHKIETFGKTVVASINGYALGGGLELAESCMLRVAMYNTKLGHPEVRIGAVAGFGGTTRLPRLIGKGRGAELLLTGKLISSEEALQFGLVNRLASAEDLAFETVSIVQEILTQAPVAVDLSWQAMHRGLNMTLEESAKLGADYFGLVATTSDFREGTSSFIQKKTPTFSGK